jgi:hypothetical protein
MDATHSLSAGLPDIQEGRPRCAHVLYSCLLLMASSCDADGARPQRRRQNCSCQISYYQGEAFSRETVRHQKMLRPWTLDPKYFGGMVSRPCPPPGHREILAPRLRNSCVTQEGRRLNAWEVWGAEPSHQNISAPGSMRPKYSGETAPPPRSPNQSASSLTDSYMDCIAGGRLFPGVWGAGPSLAGRGPKGAKDFVGRPSFRNVSAPGRIQSMRCAYTGHSGSISPHVCRRY